jgi:murein DD-endopeptidase MepM/ murein hydrolase activator NlpD
MLLISSACALPASASPSVGEEQQSAQQLEQQIEAKGAEAESLVLRYNQAQARVDALNLQIAEHQRTLAADQAAEAKDAAAVQRAALSAYMSNGGADATLEMWGGKQSVSRTFEQSHYLATVNASLDGAVALLRADESDTQNAEYALQAAEGQAKQQVADLAVAHDAATRAIAEDEAQLTRVKGNIRALLAAANARRQAEEAATERALANASRTLATTPPTTTDPTSTTPGSPDPPRVSPPPPPAGGSSGGYANPVRAVSALIPERIDQGVDFGGFGPVYAIGNGVVLNTYGSGWPGGTFIAYQLSDGPGSGEVVYVAEDLEPSVQVGQQVSSGTVLGQMYGGPNGIEMGWANPAALPDTMARAYGQYDGSDPTAFGLNFSQLLQSIGAPGGVLEGPVHGSIPSGWPQW